MSALIDWEDSHSGSTGYLVGRRIANIRKRHTVFDFELDIGDHILAEDKGVALSLVEAKTGAEQLLRTLLVSAGLTLAKQ